MGYQFDRKWLSSVQKVADDEYAWSMEGRMDKAIISVIAPASLSGPPTAAEPIVCRMV